MPSRTRECRICVWPPIAPLARLLVNNASHGCSPRCRHCACPQDRQGYIFYGYIFPKGKRERDNAVDAALVAIMAAVDDISATTAAAVDTACLDNDGDRRGRRLGHEVATVDAASATTSISTSNSAAVDAVASTTTAAVVGLGHNLIRRGQPRQ